MSTMTTAEQVWTEFRTLSPESRDQFLSRLVQDHAVRAELEDLLDIEIAERRSSEPTRPLADVLRDLEA